MKRKHEFIKDISQPLNTLGFKVSEVQIYEVCIFFSYSPINLKAHVPGLMAKER